MIYYYDQFFNQSLINLASPSNDTGGIRDRYGARPLEIGEVRAVESGRDGAKRKYDFFARVTNPNDKWMVERFRYRFVWGGGSTREQEILILPSEDRFISILGESLESSPDGAVIDILAHEWRRMRGGEEKILQDKMYLATENVELQQKEDGYQDDRLLFATRNGSPYNFYRAYFDVLLYSGRNIVGFSRVDIEKWRAEETRSIALVIDEKLPYIGKAEIYIDVNLMDKRNRY